MILTIYILIVYSISFMTSHLHIFAVCVTYNPLLYSQHIYKIIMGDYYGRKHTTKGWSKN